MVLVVLVLVLVWGGDWRRCGPDILQMKDVVVGVPEGVTGER